MDTVAVALAALLDGRAPAPVYVVPTVSAPAPVVRVVAFTAPAPVQALRTRPAVAVVRPNVWETR